MRRHGIHKTTSITKICTLILPPMSNASKKRKKILNALDMLYFILAFLIFTFCLWLFFCFCCYLVNFMCILKFSANRPGCYCALLLRYFISFCVIKFSNVHTHTFATIITTAEKSSSKVFFWYFLDDFFFPCPTHWQRASCSELHLLRFQIDWKHLQGFNDDRVAESESCLRPTKSQAIHTQSVRENGLHGIASENNKPCFIVEIKSLNDKTFKQQHHHISMRCEKFHFFPRVSIKLYTFLTHFDGLKSEKKQAAKRWRREKKRKTVKKMTTVRKMDWSKWQKKCDITSEYANKTRLSLSFSRALGECVSSPPNCFL